MKRRYLIHKVIIFYLVISSVAIPSVVHATPDTMKLTHIPVVTDVSISGATGTGGIWKVGDSLQVRWDNSATGDNNSDIVTVTADLSQVGGSANAPMIEYIPDNYQVTLILGLQSIDSIIGVTVTATDGDGHFKTSSPSSIRVDLIPPMVSVMNIDVSGGTGLGGLFQDRGYCPCFLE